MTSDEYLVKYQCDVWLPWFNYLGSIYFLLLCKSQNLWPPLCPTVVHCINLCWCMVMCKLQVTCVSTGWHIPVTSVVWISAVQQYVANNIKVNNCWNRVFLYHPFICHNYICCKWFLAFFQEHSICLCTFLQSVCFFFRLQVTGICQCECNITFYAKIVLWFVLVWDNIVCWWKPGTSNVH